MKTMMKTALLALLSGFCLNAQAVHVNQQGIGEVLIFPYYTVNNDYNTFYTVINTSDQGKAIKVRFVEGLNHEPVFQFNAYLSPFDVWTGVLSPTTSTLPNHTGEPSVLHSTSDQSCAPTLNKQGQEFIADFIPDEDSITSLQRSTEGHIEVFEMAVVTGANTALAIDHGNDGIPNDCAQLELAWMASGNWDTDPNQDLSAPSGGLSGSGLLLNVSEGHLMAYDAIALKDFWQSAIVHTAPAEVTPDLSYAKRKSHLQTDQGYQLYSWNHGYQAVSAALMKSTILNQYDLNSFIDGKTDWILNWPTKSFHTDAALNLAQPPFSELWNGQQSCESLLIKQTARNTLSSENASLSACGALALLSFQASQGGGANIFGSSAEILIPPNSQTQGEESGWALIQFEFPQQNMVDVNNLGISGLPVIGFAALRFTNFATAPGILAQYSEIKPHKHTVETFGTFDDLIFADGFEALN